LVERNRVSAQLNKPFDVVAMPRQAGAGNGYLRNVYFAYILNRNGNVALFESGPNGVNGWGYDDVIGIAPYTFNSPKKLQLDPINLFMAVWIAHEGPIDTVTGDPGAPNIGALTQLWVESAITGQLFLTSQGQTGLRDMAFGVNVSIGEGTQGLSGIPVDIAFDNLRNLGGMPNVITSFSAGSALPGNGKGLIRLVPGPVNSNEPGYMFAAVPNVTGGFGVVDVFDLAKAGVLRKDINAYQAGVQSIQVPNVSGVMDYWRQ
ncbi:MAG: hypothetical protein OSB57_00505, partial [Planctomycetota bacterium]|nr:hypothetical protein [Planctomycetota bacterium]